MVETSIPDLGSAVLLSVSGLLLSGEVERKGSGYDDFGIAEGGLDEIAASFLGLHTGYGPCDAFQVLGQNLIR